MMEIADGRTAILLAPAERDPVLGEMRGVLASAQGVVHEHSFLYIHNY